MLDVFPDEPPSTDSAFICGYSDVAGGSSIQFGSLPLNGTFFILDTHLLVLGLVARQHHLFVFVFLLYVV